MWNATKRFPSKTLTRSGNLMRNMIPGELSTGIAKSAILNGEGEINDSPYRK